MRRTMGVVGTELLAPAGTLHAVEAVLDAGADAVYVGLKGLSSRPTSADLTIEELAYAIRCCHERERRLHVALNACVPQSRLDECVHELRRIDDLGADAVIVSDWGLLRRATLDDLRMEVHASTMLGVYNDKTIRVLQDMGVCRVVLSTNLLIDEMAHLIRAVPDMLYEMVVDGGVCANDNRLCELPHVMVDGSYRVFCQREYELVVDGRYLGGRRVGSRLARLGESIVPYVEMGIRSFKIEGRTNGYRDVVPRVCRLRKLLDHMPELTCASTLHYVDTAMALWDGSVQ